MKRSHVVVIGAGMGGLAAAITLAARGQQVTLCERHATPGGKMRQVTVAGRPIDAGPTVFTMRWIFEALFELAGLDLQEHLTLIESARLARHSWVGSDSLDLYTDVDQSCEAIQAFSSAQDADNYRQFAAECEAIFHTLDARFMRAQRPNPVLLSLGAGLQGIQDLARTRPFESLWQALGKRFEDPRLRQLFARYSTYCGSSPFRAPATLMLIAHVERAGVWRVEGGMHALARALLSVADTLGVQTHLNTGVNRITTVSNRITGVVLADGQQLNCDAVVFNGDAAALNAGLLGSELARATPVRKEPSLSALTECRVAQVSGFELAHHTVFFGQDYPDEFAATFDRREITTDPTVYICAQDRHDDRQGNLPGSQTATVAPGGDAGERLLCLINAPARPLVPLERQQAIERMQASLMAHGVQLDDVDEPARVTAPQDFDQLFPASDGALYGRPTHGWMGSFKRPGARSRLKGLYLAGGSVHPGAGVPMATQSGRLAAERLCRDLRLG